MSELLVEFDETVTAADGSRFFARVWGVEDDIGRWVGRIQFTDAATNESVWTDSETVQPNRRDLEYWVTGLSRVYLDGALRRAQDESRRASVATFERAAPTSRSDFVPPMPRSDLAAPVRLRSILDPFATYVQGEGVLRAELKALSVDQVRNVAAAFAILSPETSATRDADEIREEIVLAARRHVLSAREGDVTA